MKKILTAMGNPTLNKELKKYVKYELNEEDLFYQEAVLEELSREEYEVILVSSLLQGEFEFYEFLDEIRKINITN